MVYTEGWRLSPSGILYRNAKGAKMNGEYEAMYFTAFREWLKTNTAHIIMEHKQDVIPEDICETLESLNQSGKDI